MTTESLFFYHDELCIDVLLCWLFNSMLVHNMLISKLCFSSILLFLYLRKFSNKTSSKGKAENIHK